MKSSDSNELITDVSDTRLYAETANGLDRIQEELDELKQGPVRMVFFIATDSEGKGALIAVGDPTEVVRRCFVALLEIGKAKASD